MLIVLISFFGLISTPKVFVNEDSIAQEEPFHTQFTQQVVYEDGV